MTSPLQSQLEAPTPANRPAIRMTSTNRPKREDSTGYDGQRASMTHGSGPGATGFYRLANSIDELHRLSAVYTTPAITGRILDAVGWRPDADLTRFRLLEPAAGTGEFVIQAAERLVASCRRLNVEPTYQTLGARIRAYELHPRTALGARRRVTASLHAAGVDRDVALACATEWLRTADFLLSTTSQRDYTHVVGNPPYLRWSKVPPPLKSLYEEHLPVTKSLVETSFSPFWTALSISSGQQANAASYARTDGYTWHSATSSEKNGYPGWISSLTSQRFRPKCFTDASEYIQRFWSRPNEPNNGSLTRRCPPVQDERWPS